MSTWTPPDLLAQFKVQRPDAWSEMCMEWWKSVTSRFTYHKVLKYLRTTKQGEIEMTPMHLFRRVLVISPPRCRLWKSRPTPSHSLRAWLQSSPPCNTFRTVASQDYNASLCISRKLSIAFSVWNGDGMFTQQPPDLGISHLLFA